jgi:hypothetical protein
LDAFKSTLTVTTEELQSRILCEPFSQEIFRGSSDPLFLSKYLKKQ